MLSGIHFDAGLIAAIFYKIQFKEKGLMKGLMKEHSREVDHIDNIDSIFTGKFPDIKRASRIYVAHNICGVYIT